jgi:hypothetical protein
VFEHPNSKVNKEDKKQRKSKETEKTKDKKETEKKKRKEKKRSPHHLRLTKPFLFSITKSFFLVVF